MSLYYFITVYDPPLMKSRGKIKMFVGPMFGGKTSVMITQLRRYVIASKSVIAFKYDKDIRYSVEEKISSHNGETFDAFPGSSLMPFLEEALGHDVIAIDEGQFFSDIVEFCEALVIKDKTILVAALDGDFRKIPFPPISALIPICDSIEKLCAVCTKCGKHAPFTSRIVADDRVELIGGKETYEARCRKCYILLC